MPVQTDSMSTLIPSICLTPDKAVYMCQENASSQGTSDVNLKPFGSEWRAATSSAVGEHHYVGEKKNSLTFTSNK